MRRGLIPVLVGIVAIMGTETTASPAVSCTLASCLAPTLTPTFVDSISPRKLPPAEYVPVTSTIFGKIATSDGTHPSALREATVDIDKDVKINVKGFPACKISQLKRGDQDGVLNACGQAIAGRGLARFEIALPEREPIVVTSRLTVFNGREDGGKATLLIYGFNTSPAPATGIIRATLARKRSGISAVIQIPRIAGGNGSLLELKLRIGKTFAGKEGRVGYLEAKCPDSVFKVNVPRLLFRNETHAEGLAASTVMQGAFAVPCTPKG
jgi:hypothetical protein